MTRAIKEVDILAYPFEIFRLGDEDGVGFLCQFPDFNESFSDGESVEEAIANAREALQETIAYLHELNRPIPKPSRHAADEKWSGRFNTRIPKTLHGKLARRARNEGVSLNTLVNTFIAKGMGRKS